MVSGLLTPTFWRANTPAAPQVPFAPRAPVAPFARFMT
jgi:hypothetical protein